MKKLTLIVTLLFSTVVISSSSYADWKPTAQNLTHNTIYYVDFERIRKHGGYVYYWLLQDFSKPKHSPPVYGVSSIIVYNKADCKLFRRKTLNASFYKRRMGKGTRFGHLDKPQKNWSYPPPKSSEEIILKAVCRR